MFLRGGKHSTHWNEMRQFGPTGSRFDHHPPPARLHSTHGIIYAAEDATTACAEFFQATRVINRTLNEPWIVEFSIAEPLTLLDVTGGWMLKVGGGAAIASGEREQSRKWSRVFHEAYASIDGIRYRSSLNPAAMAYALYERAARAIPATPSLHAPLTDARIAALLGDIANQIGYDLI